MSVLLKFLKASTEDHHEIVKEEIDIEIPEVQPVSEEEEYEADEHLEEVDEERREIDVAIEQFKMMESEVEERVTSIENYSEVLTIGLEQAQFSPQFAGLVHEELNGYKRLFGDDLSIPSLEDHSHETLGDFYTASLEGFGEVVSKLKASVTAASTKVMAAIQAIGTNEKAADALIKKADAALEAVSGKDFSEPVTVKLSGLGKTLHFKGAIPSNLQSAIATDQKSLNALYKSFVPTAVSYVTSVSKALAPAMNDKAKADSAAKSIIALKVPRTTIASGIADGSQLLGAKVNVVAPAKHDVNTEALGQIAQAFNGKLFGKSGTAKDGEVKLTKSDVESLLKSVKVYAEQLRQLSREAAKELKRQASDTRAFASAARDAGVSKSMTYTQGTGGGVGVTVDSGSEYSQIRAMGAVLKGASFEAPGAYKEIAKRLDGNARAVLSLAKRASDKAGKSKAAANDGE